MSLLAESECISGKMLQSGFQTLELGSLNIPVSVLPECGRSYICCYFESYQSYTGEAAIPSQVSTRMTR